MTFSLCSELSLLIDVLISAPLNNQHLCYGKVLSRERVGHIIACHLIIDTSGSKILCDLIITDVIGPRSRSGTATTSVMEGDTQRLEEAVERGEGRATLKMKRDGQAIVEEVVSVRQFFPIC